MNTLLFSLARTDRPMAQSYNELFDAPDQFYYHELSATQGPSSEEACHFLGGVGVRLGTEAGRPIIRTGAFLASGLTASPVLEPFIAQYGEYVEAYKRYAPETRFPGYLRDESVTGDILSKTAAALQRKQTSLLGGFALYETVPGNQEYFSGFFTSKLLIAKSHAKLVEAGIYTPAARRNLAGWLLRREQGMVTPYELTLARGVISKFLMVPDEVRRELTTPKYGQSLGRRTERRGNRRRAS